MIELLHGVAIGVGAIGYALYQAIGSGPILVGSLAGLGLFVARRLVTAKRSGRG